MIGFRGHGGPAELEDAAQTPPPHRAQYDETDEHEAGDRGVPLVLLTVPVNLRD